ncbi:MAG: hypothetical protein ACP5RT_02165 [Candidatus Micrarchaeia archaeon]
MKTASEYQEHISKRQKETLNRQMYLAKELYNMLLEKSKADYEGTGKTLTEYRMNAGITQIEKEKPEFAEMHSQVLQNVSERVSDRPKVRKDLGITQHAVLSDNTIHKNTKITKHQRNHAKVMQQSVSRKETWLWL